MVSVAKRNRQTSCNFTIEAHFQPSSSLKDTQEMRDLHHATSRLSPSLSFHFPELACTSSWFNFLTCFRTRRERMSVKWRPTWRNRRWGVLQMPDLCSVVLKSSCAQLGLNEWTTACGLFCADLKNVFLVHFRSPAIRGLNLWQSPIAWQAS